MRDFRVVLGLGAALLAGCGSSKEASCARGECVASFSTGKGDATCVLLRDGAMRCWGQFTDQTPAFIISPVATAVARPEGTVAISIGYEFTCTLLVDATAWCWGVNRYGALGNGSLANSQYPARVSGLTALTELVASSHHVCALLQGGTVDCWGSNWFGELGTPDVPSGPTTDTNLSYATVPTPVNGLAGARTLSLGDATGCSLKDGGRVWCWGDNRSRMLGDPANTAAFSPGAVEVPGLVGVEALALGRAHACALMGDGTVRCWGSNYHGDLGNGTVEEVRVATPGEVVGLSGVTAIAAGSSHTCALVSGGRVKCWGYNSFGQVGAGPVELLGGVGTPVEVPGLSGVTAITAGPYHSCALLPGVGVRCWGDNAFGQLGRPEPAWSREPVEVRF